MRFERRGGCKALIGFAASLLLYGCQSTDKPKVDTGEPPPIVDAPSLPSLDSESIPTVDEAESKPEEIPEPPRQDAIARSGKVLTLQAERIGAYVAHEEGSREWRIVKGSRQLILSEGSRKAVFDGVTVYLDRAFSQVKGRWQLSESDERLLLEGLMGDFASRPRSVRTIVLDPGHGGTEEGTKNETLGLYEKALTLDVCERLRTHLEQLGYRVTLTRYDDRLVSLEDRPAIATGVKADLFLSVHFNAALKPDAKGFETYMLTPAGQPSTSDASGDSAELIPYPGNAYSLSSFELAYRIQKGMVSALQRDDRGLRKARFAVLKPLTCPGVLVECGFLSNAEEALLVSTPVFREKLARTLADALDRYARASSIEEL